MLMSRSLLAVPALLLLLAGEPTYKRSSLVRLEAHVDVKAPPAAVWKALTSSKGFAVATGFRIEESDARLAKVGDVLSASVWSDRGSLVCTFASESKELRVAFEPDNASYLCQKRITLEPQGGGTRLAVVDRYTDDQAETVDKTAKDVMAEMPKQLAAFQAIVDKP